MENNQALYETQKAKNTLYSSVSCQREALFSKMSPGYRF